MEYSSGIENVIKCFLLYFSTEQPIQGLGPPLSGDMCENHNYIAYVFVYECTDWRRIAEGEVRDQCR